MMSKNLSNIIKKKVYIDDKRKYEYNISTKKQRERFIKSIEKIVRNSMEYKDYISFLKENVDMTKCKFFNLINSKENERFKIEIHHEPLTLYDIVEIILIKWEIDEDPINNILIAKEVMRLHYENEVGLIPLSKTVHQIAHNNDSFVIPVYFVYGEFHKFVSNYEEYIKKCEYIEDKLHMKLEDSKNFSKDNLNILDIGYIYVDTENNSVEKI